MKPKPTTQVRITKPHYKKLDEYRAKQGKRTNAEALGLLIDSHPAITKPRKTKGGSHV